MNQAIDNNKQKVRHQEFLIGLAIIIGAAEFAQNGKELFQKFSLLGLNRKFSEIFFHFRKFSEKFFSLTRKF